MAPAAALSAPPLEAAEFAALMSAFDPFEPAPRIAVGVSGGADSLALALLADGWARARGGAVDALTVDHGLRPEAAREAAQVGAWLAARGIKHRVLVWAGPRPRRGVQAAARTARYGLLEGWCAEQGVLHLLLAHHRDDQAETLLLRLARGSGLDGLAGMAAVVEHAACRVLRPLLGVPRARLVAALEAAGQRWIDDPSNRNRAYARSRLRGRLAALDEPEVMAERLAAAAVRLGARRAAIERDVAALLARVAAIHPAGFLGFDATGLVAASEEVGLRALAAMLTMIGGGDHPPRLERLARLYRLLPVELGGGRTLGGCRVLPRPGRVLVCREPAAVAPPVLAPPGATIAWDGRFRLRLPADAPRGLTLGAFGAARLEGADSVAAASRPSLPALRDKHGEVVAVPALGYEREGAG
ncbi:MAG TPA: tRNA lysidine(34) synthetase TilS, partial [Stellaceae bacterium]